MTTTDKTYQGHKDRAHWSVALYLDNEYDAYAMATDIVKRGMAEGIGPGAMARLICRRLGPGARTYERFAFTVPRVRAWVEGEMADRATQKGGK